MEGYWWVGTLKSSVHSKFEWLEIWLCGGLFSQAKKASNFYLFIPSYPLIIFSFVDWFDFCGGCVKAAERGKQHLAWGSFKRAYVSLGPPMQAPQLGLAGVSQPASSNIWAQVLPSHPGTGRVYTSIQTWNPYYMNYNIAYDWSPSGYKSLFAIFPTKMYIQQYKPFGSQGQGKWELWPPFPVNCAIRCLRWDWNLEYWWLSTKRQFIRTKEKPVEGRWLR